MTTEPQLKKRIEIPPDLDSEARQVVAENIIDFIKERTENNKDINGKKFAPYSQSYVNSTDFKAAGKSKSDVNLRLTDEMMESIQLLDHGKGYIVIGYEAGTEANNKAVWNQRSDNGPSRLFLGVAEKDLERILAKTTVETDVIINKKADSIVNSILKSLGF